MSDLSRMMMVGDLLVIETGEYSDSSWHGPVRMLVNASKADLAEAFKSEWNPKDFGEWEDDPPNPSCFLAWLIRTKRAEDVAYDSWHVGSYGHFDPY